MSPKASPSGVERAWLPAEAAPPPRDEESAYFFISSFFMASLAMLSFAMASSFFMASWDMASSFFIATFDMVSCDIVSFVILSCAKAAGARANPDDTTIAERRYEMREVLIIDQVSF